MKGHDVPSREVAGAEGTAGAMGGRFCGITIVQLSPTPKREHDGLVCYSMHTDWQGTEIVIQTCLGKAASLIHGALD